jgi:L-lactate utilization protein LutC
MPDARDEILNRLRTQTRPEQAHLPAWRSRRHFDDMVARFADSLAKVYGETFREDSLESALTRLDTLLNTLEAGRIVVTDETPLSDIDFAVRWPDREWHIVDGTPGDLRAFCASADVGVSSAEAALAETASLVVTSGPGRSRLATVFPPVHIALVPVARLTTDIFTWNAARSGPLPASLTLVSGPSKTGDIEQTLSVGVHGPKRFIVIFYDD